MTPGHVCSDCWLAVRCCLKQGGLRSSFGVFHKWAARGVWRQYSLFHIAQFQHDIRIYDAEFLVVHPKRPLRGMRRPEGPFGRVPCSRMHCKGNCAVTLEQVLCEGYK